MKNYPLFKTLSFYSLFFLLIGCASQKRFQEKNGFLQVEAEDFNKQTNDSVRKWYVIDKKFSSDLEDADASHIKSASKNAYIEILPDTRQTHDDQLIRKENFSNIPGIAVVHYNVSIKKPGRYYVWVKAFSTGSEDNGVHVGLNGKWPNSGKRMQWCKGKGSWYWESKQRTKDAHCGIEHAIYLDVDRAGNHVIQFSMREDGFEMDKWLMTTDKNYNPRTGK